MDCPIRALNCCLKSPGCKLIAQRDEGITILNSSLVAWNIHIIEKNIKTIFTEQITLIQDFSSIL